jgi:hypothetical protein
LSEIDRAGDILVLGLWGGVIYAIAMVWTTCALIDRWRGPYDKIRTGKGSVMAALVLSALWPVVLVYLYLLT